MSDKNFSGGATPTVTTKKVAPPGKKKVIRRLVKNAKTGEVIKTEIVRIDSNGETTVTSYPAGTPVPSLGNLQAAASGKKTPRAASPSGKKESSQTLEQVPKGKDERDRIDIGPSVPVNVPGLDDLLEKEQQLIKAKLDSFYQQQKMKEEIKTDKKAGDESLETELISILRRKRQKDPKSRRRGLVASTMSRRADSDDEDLEENGAFTGDTDYRNMQANVDEEEENKKRKERHRRRRKEKHREKPSAYRDGEDNDIGIDAHSDQRPYDPEDEEQELPPLEEAERLAKQLQASATLKQQEKEAAQQGSQSPLDAPSPAEEKPRMSDISDDDLDKPKKKKKKHKKQKKKKKKLKRKDSGMDEGLTDLSEREKRSSIEKDPKEVVGLRKEDIELLNKISRSRSQSLSSLTLSSISSDFSDSFDFAEVVPPMPMGDFNNPMFRGGFRGRGMFNVPFRGRAMFRGFPRGRPPRGSFRGRGGFMGGGMFPEGMDPMAAPMFMGRGARGMWRGGPWGPMMPGRGGFNNVEESGIGIYVEDGSNDSRKSSRSYSSYSSYSSRSRSRSRRRHRRRHHSSSRSYSSYSRSSRSYSRSYSRSSRSYSRSYSRSSRSSYSRSRSRSRSKSRKSGSSSGRSRRSSPDFRNIYSQGATQQDTVKQEEEVPWWAEFDKTYEVQQKAEKEAKAKAIEDAKKKEQEDKAAEPQPAIQLPSPAYDFSDLTKDDIDVVRCLMSVVDKACRQQDSFIEDVRYSVTDLLDKVCSLPELQSAESGAAECINSMLDQLCPDDPTTTERLKQRSDESLQLPDLSGTEHNKLLRCYTIACDVTERTRAMRRQARMLSASNDKSDGKESESDGDRRKTDDRRGRHGRRRRGRRRRRRSYSRSSYSSSSSEKRTNLVNLTVEQQQSLQQAQQMLIFQQQQLQAAGILPKSLALPIPVSIPSLMPTTNTTVPEPEILSNRWDKDMDALLKTKSKDDITRKLLQRMKEKKQFGEGGDVSPTFQTRGRGADLATAEKVFSGPGNLKSRKIAISSIDKSKVFDEMSGYKKSDIVAAQASMEMEASRDSERTRALEQRGKLEAWSDEQKGLKEEVKRKMREEIEKAERAKKEKMKEEILEEQRQREIMRIREEVRKQIREEIREEIEKQRKQVLEDVDLKSQLMELEALRQSKVPKSEGLANKTYIKPLEESFVKQQDKHKEEMNVWLEQHGKRASEMSVDEMRKMQTVYMQQLHHWSQQQQKAYMQWYWHQQQHYQQHTQESEFNRSGGFYNRSIANEPQHSGPGDFPADQPPPASRMNMGSSMQPGMPPGSSAERGSTFTHAPSKGPHPNEMEGTTHTMPERGVMSVHVNDAIRQQHPNRPPFAPQDQFNRRGPRGNFPPQHDQPQFRGPSMQQHPRMNQPRFNHPDMHPQEPLARRRQFGDHHDPNQPPIHQYPPADMDHGRGDPNRMPPSSGMHGHGPPRFGRPQFDQPMRPDGPIRPRFDHPGHPPMDGHIRPLYDQRGHMMEPHGRPLMDQHGRPLHDQPIRPPMEQRGTMYDQLGRPMFEQQQQGPPPVDQQGPPLGPPLNQQGRPLLDQHGQPFLDQHGHPIMEQPGQPPFEQRGPLPQSNQPAPHGLNQPGLLPIQQHEPPHMGPGQPRDAPMMNQPGPRFMNQPEPFVTEKPLMIQNTGSDQPLPPGVDAAVSQPIANVVPPPGVEKIAPPGEEKQPVPETKAVKNVEETPPDKSSKKKKKKHRKHRKKRDSSSSDDDAQRAAIVEQLRALQAVEEGELAEVEDGEVQSDDDKKPSAIAAAAALLKKLESKKKKKHRKKKKRRRETSSEDEDKEEAKPTEDKLLTDIPGDVPGIPPPPFFPEAMLPEQLPPRGMPNPMHPVGQPHPQHEHLGLPPPDHIMHNPDRMRDLPPVEDRGPSKPFSNSPYAPHIQQPPERYNIPSNPQGAGEPHPGAHHERMDHFNHPTGPGGDHTLGQNHPPEQKRPLSPHPVVVPTDPREMEMWAKRMEERYADEKPQQPGKPPLDFGGRKVEKIPSLMDKYIPEPEPRRIVALSQPLRGLRRGGRQHPDDDRMLNRDGRRKRERGVTRGRGRKRRRGLPPRDYHDWDQPADDGLIYYYSDSDHSSGWGSDKDFDEMLAKKKRETLPRQEKDGAAFSNIQPIHVTSTRRPSPARHDPWDRPMMGEPQGIPVIGGSKLQAQPIPSLANRGGPPLGRNEYDHLGRPLARDEEFIIHQDYRAPNEQPRMSRGAWDHTGPGVIRDLPPHQPPSYSHPAEPMRERYDALRRPPF